MKSLLFVIPVVATLSLAAEKPVQMKDLPPAVQKSVQEQSKGAQLKGLSKEVEQGKTFYEAETVVNGRTRDLLFDAAGTLVEIEEETPIETIPAAARAAIEKKASGGKIKKLETVTKGQSVTYEAAIVRGGKTQEVAVKADGSAAK